MQDCIFCKIRDKEIPKEFYYEDEDVMVFSDIAPIKPIHLLVVPKEHIEDFLDAGPVLFQKLARVVQNTVLKEGLNGKGYRLIVNGGGAQLVNHLHIHITGPHGKATRM